MLINKHKFEIYESFLVSDRIFTDTVIGILLGSSCYASLSRVAKITGLTERRISLAAQRLQRSGSLIKIHNYIIAEPGVHGDRKQINKCREELLKFHGIRTPEPIFYKGQWLMVLYAPNSYFFGIVAKGHKEIVVQLTPKVGKKCFITPLTSGLKYNLWAFKNSIYTFHDYLNDFGFKNL